MKIRIYSPSYPYPPTEGAFQVIFDQVNGLAGLGHEIELIVWQGATHSTDSSPFHPAVKVVTLADHLPRSKSRIRRVLRSLLSTSSSPEEAYYPACLATHLRLPGDTALEIFHYSFAINWLRRIPNGPGRGSTRRAIVFHNLESDLSLGRAGNEGLLAGPLHLLNAAKLALRELEASNFADELWFLSPKDLDDYRSRMEKLRRPKPALLRVTPPTYPSRLRSERIAAMKPSRSKAAPVFGFIGGLGFLPNHLSAMWILKQVAPLLVEEGFSGQIQIAGKGAPPELQVEAARFPFVKLLGFVPDAENYWSELSFSLAPHLGGSGVRIKILESLASGVPTLTTPAALEGLHPALRTDPLLRVSADPAQWARWMCDAQPFEERVKERERLPRPEFEVIAVYDFIPLV